MRVLIIFAALIFMAACSKKDDPTVHPLPIDSISRYPYNDTFTGTQHVHRERDIDFYLDTMLQNSLIVRHPDSTSIVFLLSFTDYERDTSTTRFKLYSALQVDSFAGNKSGVYQDSARHHKTQYTLTGNAVTVHKIDANAGDITQVDFDGVRK